MQKIRRGEEPALSAALEYTKGCPACDHADLELERELQAFAQLFFDIYVETREAKAGLGSDPGVDKTP